MKKDKAIRGAMAKAILVAMICLIAGTEILAKNIFDWRMVMYPNLPVNRESEMVLCHTLLERMQSLGYNGIYIDGYWLRKMGMPAMAKYKSVVQKFVADATRRGIAVIPMSQDQRGTLEQDPNLREVFPTIGTPFKVVAGVGQVVEDATVTLLNGGFEQPLAGSWTVGGPFKIASESRPGSTGNKCLILDDPTGQTRRVRQLVTVKPYRTYELSVWAKVLVSKQLNKGLPTQHTNFTVQSSKQPWLLKDREFQGVSTKGTQWKLIRQKFNSLANSQVWINLNATGYFKFEGKVWFDDAEIREVGLYEISKNPSVPVVVKTKAGKILVEGTDYVVGNEKLTIPAGSSLREGDELTVNWGTVANVMCREAETSFCHEDVWESMRAQIKREDDWFGTPRARLMKYSEWRLGGWDPACEKAYKISQNGSGAYWAGTANKTAELYREVNSNRISLILSDAYNPAHNSKTAYYAINGGNLGGGHLLDTNMIVVNWYCWGGEGLKYFAGVNKDPYGAFGVKTSRHRQILSANSPGACTKWINALDKAEKEGLKDGDVVGMGYQMFGLPAQVFLDKVGPIQQVCKTAGRWGSGPIDFPPVSISSGKRAVKLNSLSLRVASSGRTGMRGMSFTVPCNYHVRLTITNLHGQTVIKVLDEQMASGAYNRKVDVSKMAAGVYFAMLKVNGKTVQSISRKMIVF